MKNKFIKLNKPCLENWENMKPSATGNFCNHCSKTVIDFTHLNQLEVAAKLKQAKGTICARITKTQLNLPLLDLEIEKKYNLPYSNIAAGIMIATSLATVQPIQAESNEIQTELLKSKDSILNLEKNDFEPKNYDPKKENFTTIYGIVKTEKDGTPIKNAKITFVTVKKLISIKTCDDGRFSLKIPTELIDNDNVIRVSYTNVKAVSNEKNFYRYETTDYILTKEDLKTEYKIVATPELMYLGGISSYSENEIIPIVFINGKEIKYRDYVNTYIGKNSSYNFQDKDHYYFETEKAIAIYGKKAKDGLYILVDKNSN